MRTGMGSVCWPGATATPTCSGPRGSRDTRSWCGVGGMSPRRPSWRRRGPAATGGWGRGRQGAERAELDEEEAGGYWREVLRVASALERHYRPVKLNLQMLGNAVPHLHTHLLPRFAVDPAPGRPLPFPEGERPAVPEDLLRGDALALRALV